MRIMVDRANLQFNVGAEQWETDILHTSGVLSLVKSSICGQIHIQI
jgi:hypothetical protein